MNTIKKLISLTLFAVMLLSVAMSFSGCGKESAALDYGTYDKLEIDGYYLKTLNSVENEGVILETNYYVCTDKELTNAVGAMTARFDEDGGLSGYDAVVERSDGQSVISFSKLPESSNYTDTLYNKDYTALICTSWESISISWETEERFLSRGTVYYYSNGVESSYSEEQYYIQNGKEYLSCTVERKRNEDGSLASEKITNYDEDGKIKQ